MADFVLFAHGCQIRGHLGAAVDCLHDFKENEE
jgi:hypothetical protein